MKEALDYFLNEDQVCSGTEDPDEGIDYIFMLDPEEWAILMGEWNHRSISWKSGVTYFAGFRRLPVNKEILMKAIHDEATSVYEQGLLSLHQTLTEEWEETGSTSAALSEQEKGTVLEKLTHTSDSFREYPEYNELINLLTDR
ncbi:hypothetical protein GCM10023310_63060 [Paenibacillus vulneris]|uniref:DUF4375 domain-containing protein n=1 Tax=Paenibacillus vulneris TaxID=1133364 RepID=A0ABW3UU91_9BACL|nr:MULTISPECIES: hypothetical protein [unclassified Paenibacillus]MBE1443809.1 hypothetical protein [Paenibacillus sp. OAS669]